MRATTERTTPDTALRNRSLRSVTLLILITLLGLPSLLHGQTVAGVEIWRVGGGIGGSIIDYDADFSSLPGVPSCCPGYEDGNGSEFELNGTFEIPLIERFRLINRLRFGLRNGSLITDEQELVTPFTDTLRATFRHTIELHQPFLQLEELIGFAPLRRFRLLAGVRVEMLPGGTFEQREEIVAPDNIRYENDTRTRMVYEGDIPDEGGLQLALAGGLTYDFALDHDRRLIMAPELMYWHGLTDLISSRTLSVEGLRLGVNLMWVNRTEERAPSPLEPGIYYPIE